MFDDEPRTSDPKAPLSGAGGVNNNSRASPTHVGSSLFFLFFFFLATPLTASSVAVRLAVGLYTHLRTKSESHTRYLSPYFSTNSNFLMREVIALGLRWKWAASSLVVAPSHHIWVSSKSSSSVHGL